MVVELITANYPAAEKQFLWKPGNYLETRLDKITIAVIMELCLVYNYELVVFHVVQKGPGIPWGKALVQSSRIIISFFLFIQMLNYFYFLFK